MAVTHDPFSYSMDGLLSVEDVIADIAIGQIDPPYCKTTGGESRAIRVNNAGTTEGTVTIGGTSCTIISWTDVMIVITTPAKAAGQYDLVVTHAGSGEDTLTNGVTYYDPASDPIFVVETDAVPEDDAHD